MAEVFVELRAGDTRGELRRSVGDRIDSRVRPRRRVDRPPVAGRSSSVVRHYFDDAKLMLLTSGPAPHLASLETNDGQLLGAVDPAALSGALLRASEFELFVTDPTGANPARYPIVADQGLLTFAAPVDDFGPGIDYCLAITSNDNPGLPYPLTIGPETSLPAGEARAVIATAGIGGQIMFRRNGNTLRATLTEASRRLGR